MQKYINILSIVALNATLSYATTPMTDMSAIQVRIQEAQKHIQSTQRNIGTLRFLTAPIEDTSPLRQEEIERFIQRLKKHSQDHKYMTQKLQETFPKAAKTLPKDASYDTFVHKTIALSGIKDALEARAKKMGYDNAQEAMVRTTRILRAFHKVEADRQIAKRPAQQQQIIKMLMAKRAPAANPADVEAVKPYLDQYKKALKGQ